jgi:Tfp pilus assembly protein PilF
MARFALALVLAAALTSTGCLGLFGNSTNTNQPPAQQTATGGTPPGLLIGPEHAAKAPATELPPRQAAVACLAAADELAQKGNGAEAAKQAIALYEKARTLDPATAASAGVGRRLAVLYDLVGDFSKAQAEYDPLLKETPNDPKLLNDIGYSYYCRGDLATADTFLRKAVQADPALKAAWLNLGLVAGATGKMDDAFAAFQKGGTAGEAHANMGFVLAASGKTAEAKAEYRKALTIEPGLTTARAALERLENPPKVDPNVIQTGGADHGKPKRRTAADVPNIHELEQRMQQAEGRK